MFKGLARKSASEKRKSGTKLSEGKDPIPFKLYKRLCQWMIEDGGSESVFGHAFITLTWNLICRSKNTVYIHRNHISWKNNSMTILFAHMKNDMEGFEAKYERHVYANPTEPSICCVTAVAKYLATFPSDGCNGSLFPDGSYERFRKYLDLLVHKHATEMDEMGINPANIGVHSIRKGAATYCCSGTTAGPTIASVCNRAGWTMGRVKDTYIRYEAAADHFVGQIVAGLDIHSEAFACSPAHFFKDDTDRVQVDAAIASTFPMVVSTQWRPLISMLLASLLNDRPYLIDKTSAESPFVNTAFFRDETYPDTLTSAVFACPVSMGQILVSSFDWNSATDNFPQLIEAMLEAILDRRAIGGGNLTMERLQNEFLAPLVGKIDAIQLSVGMPRAMTAPVENLLDVIDGPFIWDGAFRAVPEGYSLNRKMTALAAWHIYHHGEVTGSSTGSRYRIQPMKLILPNAAGWKLRRDKRLHYRLRQMCDVFDKEAKIGHSTPSIMALNSKYVLLASCLPSNQTASGRTRRTSELSWVRVQELMASSQTSSLLGNSS